MNYGTGFVPLRHPMDEDDKRRSFQEKIMKPFNAIINDNFPDFKVEASIEASLKGELGDYYCKNVLTIWPKFSKSRPHLKMKYQHIQEPNDIGKVIKINLPTYATDMIDEEHPLQDVGFVPLTLSRKWLAENIHMMLKDGIETWAPKLPVDKVAVLFPTLDEENRVGVSRREAIKVMLVNMFDYSKVDIHNHKAKREATELCDWGKDILKDSVLIEERGECVVIYNQAVPFILTEEDFRQSCMDLHALREVTKLETVDWVVFVAPVRQQEYIEMCFTAAKHKNWIVTHRKKWNPAHKNEYPITTYAGYRTCDTGQEELNTLLRLVKLYCYKVAADREIRLLNYSAYDVFRCVLLYTYLKNHRLADCTFKFNEMVKREENTFVYLLHSLAKIRKVAKASREKINELKKASDLILETSEELEGSKERDLEFHLLEFTDVLEESCLYILPHMMCEYLYDLAIKFNSYYDLLCEVDVAKTSTLLLCAATEVVMDKCFQLLGIDRKPSCSENAPLQSSIYSEEVAGEPDKKKPKKVEIIQEQKFKDRFITPSFVSGPRDPARNSRIEFFGYRTLVTSDDDFYKGKLFGRVSVSDKYGYWPDGGDYLFEHDFPYVHLFDVEWCNAIEILNGRYEFFGNLSSRHSVPFSSSVEIYVKLYATSKEKHKCFEVSKCKYKINLSEFWRKNLSTKCGRVITDGEDGTTEIYYIAIKKAVDTTLEVKCDAGGRQEVYGHISAYYGKFSYEGCDKSCYRALLFNSKLKDGILSLSKSELAVPDNASLIIKAFFEDRKTGEVFRGTCEFVPDIISQSKTMVGLRGATTCSLELTVVWK